MVRSPPALVVIAVLAGGCLGSGSGALGSSGRSDSTIPPHGGPFTSLKITYRGDAFQNGKVVQVTVGQPILLSCDPPSGHVMDPTAACRLLHANRKRFVGRASPDCMGGPMRWNVTIQGLLFGHPVRRRYDMCDYPEARAWTDLGGTQLIGIVPGGSPEAQAGPQNR